MRAVGRVGIQTLQHNSISQSTPVLVRKESVMRKTVLLLVTMLLGSVVLWSTSGAAQVTGTVLVAGRPVSGIRIAIVPMDNLGKPDPIRTVFTTTDGSGRYSACHLPGKALVVAEQNGMIGWKILDGSSGDATISLVTPTPQPQHNGACTVYCCCTPLFWGLSWYCSWDNCGFSSCILGFGCPGCKRC